MAKWSEAETADKLVRLSIVHGNIEELGPDKERSLLLFLGARALEKDPEYYFFLIDKMRKEKDASDSEQTLEPDST